MNVDNVLHHYLVCALWSSTDNSREDGGDPLDDNYGIDDIAPESIAEAREEIEGFIRDYGTMIQQAGMSEESLGHDIWLTRNHHGAGFWDRGYPDRIGTALTEAADALGGADPYISDDGKVFIK